MTFCIDVGNVWDPKKCSRDLEVDRNGTRVRNTGSKDKVLTTVAELGHIHPSYDPHIGFAESILILF